MMSRLLVRQTSFPDMCPLAEDLQTLSRDADLDRRGLSLRPVPHALAALALDQAGYLARRPLSRMRLLEPAFGEGDFLLPALTRLLGAWKACGGGDDPQAELGDAVRAVEMHTRTFEHTRSAVLGLLQAFGIGAEAAWALGARWLLQGSFLLAELSPGFDCIVGQVPGVPGAALPPALLAELRRHHGAVRARGDLGLHHTERALQLLAPAGVLALVCDGRWTSSPAAGPLRELVALGGHLRVQVELGAAPQGRGARPALSVIARAAPGPTRLASLPSLERAALAALSAALDGDAVQASALPVREVPAPPPGRGPWALAGGERMALLRRLQRDVGTLEQAGCSVGTGVTSGADAAFVGPLAQLDVEDERKLPLVTARDVHAGAVTWGGMGVVNPFVDGPAAGLVDLDLHPRLQRHLQAHRPVLAARSLARREPAQWYRTQDRITPALAWTPKLLIPTRRSPWTVAFEPGRCYPHRGLIHVSSRDWDLHALQAVLLSGTVQQLLGLLAPAPGARLQAATLRQLPLPSWPQVPARLRRELIAAAQSMDAAACNRCTCELYGLSDAERALLDGPAG